MARTRAHEEAAYVKRLKRQLADCDGFEGSAQATDTKKALDYYFQRARGDEVPGRSQVVSGDLSAMVEAVLAQMLEAFGSDNIALYDALGPDDEWQAQLESDTAIYFVMKQGGGRLEIAQAIKDALLVRRGVVKTWVEESPTSVTKDFTNVTTPALSALLTQPLPGTEMKVQEYDPDAKTARLKITKTNKQFRCEAIETFLCPKNWDGHDIQRIPFCGEVHVTPRSDLVRMGLPKDKVDKLRAYNPGATQPDRQARNLRSNVTPVTPSDDPAQDSIEWYELYVLRDKDGDGISERYRTYFSYQDNVLLDEVAVETVPYAHGVAFINPHRLNGISLYDKLRTTQDVNTGLLRALNDNVNTVTKQRLAYLDGKVNVDDVDDGRPNGSIRVRASVGDIRSAVMPFAVPDQSMGILTAINNQRQIRTEQGGAALELASGNAQIGGDRMGSMGLDRAYSVMEQLSAMMTKNIAMTLLRGIFLNAHAALRENYDYPVPIKQGGRWQTPIPAQWNPRAGVTIKVGMSPGERQRQAAAMQTLLNAQMTLSDKGMDNVLCGLDGFYALLIDWSRVSDIPQPERYVIDPQSQGAQQAIQSKQQAAKQQQDMQVALMTQAVQLEQMRVALEKYKADQTTQFDYWNAILNSEVEEAKIAGDATVKLITAKQKPDADTNEPGSKTASKESASPNAAR